MMCLVTVAIWLVHPFAAALVVPALHLWLLALILDIRMPAVLRAGLVLAGLLPVAGVDRLLRGDARLRAGGSDLGRRAC